MRKKSLANRLKTLYLVVDHINLLFSIYRKIFQQPSYLKALFYEVRMKKEYDDEIERFSKLGEKFTAC